MLYARGFQLVTGLIRRIAAAVLLCLLIPSCALFSTSGVDEVDKGAKQVGDSLHVPSAIYEDRSGRIFLITADCGPVIGSVSVTGHASGQSIWSASRSTGSSRAIELGSA